jgi:hypothetical protein
MRAYGKGADVARAIVLAGALCMCVHKPATHQQPLQGKGRRQAGGVRGAAPTE